MATITHDDLCVCTDCYMFVCIGSVGDLDMVIEAALEAIGGHMYPDTNSETGDGIDEFSWRPCRCCHSKLGGARYRMIVLDA